MVILLKHDQTIIIHRRYKLPTNPFRTRCHFLTTIPTNVVIMVPFFLWFSSLAEKTRSIHPQKSVGEWVKLLLIVWTDAKHSGRCIFAE